MARPFDYRAENVGRSIHIILLHHDPALARHERPQDDTGIVAAAAELRGSGHAVVAEKLAPHACRDLVWSHHQTDPLHGSPPAAVLRQL
jgi:hypothetical protein